MPLAALVAMGETNGHGFYSMVPAVRSGSYRVGFEPRVGSRYIASFDRGKLTLANANSISVTAPTPLNSVTDILLRAAYLPLTHRYIGVEHHARDYLDRVRVDGSFSPSRAAAARAAAR